MIMKKTSIIYVVLSLFLISGCASNKLGTYAVYEAELDKQTPPLQISARFNETMCSRFFGYIDFSIVNNRSSWKTMESVRLHFPYKAVGSFDVVSGRELSAWADAESKRQGRESHNSAMARLAVGAIGAGLIAEGNSNNKKAGAGLMVGAAATNAVDKFTKNINEIESAKTTSSNHILANDVLIPPGMDRQFWLLLNAKDSAPLMGWIGVSYTDEENQSHSFYVKLDNWNSCDWQQKRKNTLKTIGFQDIKKSHDWGYVRGSNVSIGTLLKIESYLQNK